MDDSNDRAARCQLAHQARQPLNTISLISANIRARMVGHIDPEQEVWLATKLDKLDRQIENLARLLELPV